MNTFFNPYTNATLQTRSFDSIEEINIKLKVSGQAYKPWKNTPFLHKKEHFEYFLEILTEQKDALAREITMEMGKPITESLAEIEKCIGLTTWYLKEAADLLKSRFTNHSETTIESSVHYESIGCILGIMPWNFPYWQVFRFAIPTLLIGNTVLLKHAPNVQGCATNLSKLFHLAGFPEGVF